VVVAGIVVVVVVVVVVVWLVVDETVTQLDGDVEVGGSSEAGGQFYQNQSWHQGLLCKRTSYHGNIRGRYAGIGYTYDAELDEFIAPVVEEINEP